MDRIRTRSSPSRVALALALPALLAGCTVVGSDYVAPAGLSAIREMKPRASVRDVGAPARREKPKKSPALPSVATPTFKPPAPGARPAGPVQKPDVPLTAELLKQSSPLAGILKKHKDETKKQRGVIVEVEEVGIGSNTTERSISPSTAPVTVSRSAMSLPAGVLMMPGSETAPEKRARSS